MIKYLKIGVDKMKERFCTDLQPKLNLTTEDISLFKEAGFNNVHISATDKPYGIEAIYDTVNLAAKAGVKAVNLHPYYKYNGFMWHNCLERNDALKFNFEQIEICKELGMESVVLHSSQGEGNYIVSEEGIDAYKRLAEKAEKGNVVLCIENLKHHNQLTPIFENIQSSRLKFCYDSGHHFAFAPERDFLKEFGNKLYFTHLHDNDGQNDSHLLPGDGKMDFEKLKNGLEAIRYTGYLNLEVKTAPKNYRNESLFEYLKNSYERLINIFGE